MIICFIICFTFIVCFSISARIYYKMKINKDFTVKAKDIRAIINAFESNYIEGHTYSEPNKTKYNGKGIDIYNLLRCIRETLSDVK